MEADTPGLLYTLGAFALALGVLVFIHEWGHYYVGRLLGVGAEAFSIGFGPEIAGWTDRRGTRWRVSLIPLGGYVKFVGDMNPASVPDARQSAEDAPPDAFHTKALWRRALIVGAGPAVNLAFAVLIFAATFWINGQSVNPAIVEDLVPGSAAEAAGIQPGDRIVAVDGERIDRFTELNRRVRINAGTPMSVTVLRAGDRRTLTITPDRIEREDRFGNRYTIGQLGIYRQATEQVRQLSLPMALVEGVRETGRTAQTMYVALRQIILGLRPVEDLSGPVKIAQYSGQQLSLGAETFILFMALISVNLGLVNLLPIPVLDGGHLLFYAIEAVTGGPVPPRVQELGNLIGLALVLSLMLLVTWNDVSSL
ncbi:RIP metalloprotease RseP [Rhodothalassium salexigens]|uniref:Zinc metalloprotease n=1 Tax=Rhodothalassium salexigens DSM 2132 TaxID=1188247 RepID=A0A4V2SQA2_RHOSA|nr:RIP metalloprotease RseP [Rhodothalassium salexigens]MBB4210081.1 regulator of sigma E protease [Rhodothalassium salexigens DSM 2132]MBK1639583.1 RIP metalloprotease RseP [Rhodothalassium salexigens DSM 2132]MBK5911945.1 RIP metalloprotease RseP [Rhodothalassium salexigens]MBK5922109.1 RIP metalloprotease RseP [Rhodothalassium salexigens]TCP38246.1 site-2 protease [Rhodothalassium salexigens DSM 2132]